MPTYCVPMTQEITGYVYVEADSPDEAIEEAYKEGLPGVMFLDHTYPDETDWEAQEPFVSER